MPSGLRVTSHKMGMSGPLLGAVRCEGFSSGIDSNRFVCIWKNITVRFGKCLTGWLERPFRRRQLGENPGERGWWHW